ncbi:MAG: ribosomal-processing cysteine protease Prp [Clostridia bacterium]|nr:ribosomal-processing cysteine protease Prp [Clostridia bacterium]
MIKVIVRRDEARCITSFNMSGHAGYAEYGSDIVCAGASTLFYTAANALETICRLSDTAVIKEDEETDFVQGSIILPEIADKEIKDRAQVIMATILTGYISLASSVNEGGKRYIEIIET